MTDDFLQLENRLRLNRHQMSNPELRDRIVRAVATELSSAPRWDGWRWLATAAVVLLVLNISMISASQNEFTSGPVGDGDQLSAELHAIKMIEAQNNRDFQ